MSFSRGFSGSLSAVSGMIQRNRQLHLKKEELEQRERLSQTEAELERGRQRGAAQQRRINAAQVRVAQERLEFDRAEAERDPKFQFDESLKTRVTELPFTLSRLRSDIPELGPVVGPLLQDIAANPQMTRKEANSALHALEGTPQLAEARAKILEKAAKLEKAGDEKAGMYKSMWQALRPGYYSALVDRTMGASPAYMAEYHEDVIKPQEQYESFFDPKTQARIKRDVATGEETKIAGTPSKGNVTRIKSPDGTEIYMGPLGDPTTRMTGELQEKYVQASESLVRLKEIQAKLDPAFTTFQGKFRGTMTNLWDMINSGSLSEEDAQFLANYKAFAQDVSTNLNLHIQAITGAQMSYQEAQRLIRDQPNLGKTWITGDGPVAFTAKLNNLIRKMEGVQARYQDYIKQGYTPEQIADMAESGQLEREAPISNYTPGADEKEIRDYGEELEAKFRKQGKTGTDLDRAVLDELDRIYGD